MKKHSHGYFYTVDRAIESFFKEDSPFFINIGANDGKKFDPFYKHAMRGSWSGVLVEPLPDAVCRLRENYTDSSGDIVIVEAAVAEHDGSIVMRRVDPTMEPEIGEWTPYIAEVRDHDSPYNLSRDPHVAPHMIEVECKCLQLTSLLQEQKVEAIDIVQIDTEGYDYTILKQLDLTHYQPRIIHFEYGQLPDEERTAAKKLLEEAGYVYALTNVKDMLAVPKELLTQLISEEELEPYKTYLDDNSVRSKEDLVCALILLGQFVSCITGRVPISSKTSLNDPKNYEIAMRDSGGARKPNIVEALDAIKRMKPLFRSEEQFFEFLKHESPPLTFHESKN